MATAISSLPNEVSKIKLLAQLKKTPKQLLI